VCGIYGIVSLRDGVSPDPELLAPMARVTVHRGPDDEGVLVRDGIALGMRRLSIIDVSTGQQPIANEDSTVWALCNGEIYNFREIRRELIARGHRFRTGSDTEVLVHLYEQYGLDLVDRLEGMFGFAIWDEPRRRLVVGRDRLGIKPIYYHRGVDRLVYASEAKAILQVPGIDAEIDPVALEEYLSFGYTPNGFSLFKRIAKLPPASLMICEGGEVTVKTYWQVPRDIDTAPSAEMWADEARAEIERAVQAEMVSDVPLGAFLSGGIDSSAVVAMMARHSDQPVKTYSIGFDTGKAGAYYNELPYARKVAGLFSTTHKEILVRPNVAELMPKLLWHMDEPVADSAFITTYLVAQFARRDVTVILSGVGGDELFGGYRRYLGDHYANRYNKLPSWLRRRFIAPAADFLPSDRHSPLLNLSRHARTFIKSSGLSNEDRYRSYVEAFSAESLDRILTAGRSGRIDSLDDAFAAARGGDGLNRLMRIDLATQLPNDLLMLTDKMTMANSIECRVPLLNHRLVELGARIPADVRIANGEMKNVLKRALGGLLPDDILHRKKRGFGAPMGAWLKDEMAPLMRHFISRETVTRRGWLDWPEVEQTMTRHATQKADHTDHLIALLNLEIWAQLYLDGRTPEDLTGELSSKGMA
jgi:asparagine synthase (glutamine-hydrolysing)